MTALGWVGVAMLVVGSLVIVIEAILMVIWGMRVGRRTLTLNQRIETERRLLQSDVERLKRAVEETRLLWQPYRRALRWLSHPLLIALAQSYRRRRAGAR